MRVGRSHQVMDRARQLFLRWFAGADVEALVDLHAVCTDHLAVRLLADPQRQLRLLRGRWTNHAQKRVVLELKREHIDFQCATHRRPTNRSSSS